MNGISLPFLISFEDSLGTLKRFLSWDEEVMRVSAGGTESSSFLLFLAPPSREAIAHKDGIKLYMHLLYLVRNQRQKNCIESQCS